jgi:hypothetical protein
MFMEITAIYVENHNEKQILSVRKIVFLISKQVAPLCVEGLRSNISLSSMTARLENQVAFSLAMFVVLCSG